VAVVASLALAAGALAAAGVFARAAVRYRFVAVAFALVAAVGPLALLAAALRPAGSGIAASAAAASGLSAYVLPLLLLGGAVAAALLLELACDLVRLRRIKRGADVLGSVPVRGALIGVSPVVATPTAIGYFHPAVVVPAGFRARVDDGEWDAVIAHECAHLARADDWAKALQSAVMRACWWLPGLWMLGRALDLERELASDERAAHETGPRRYAACLLRLATARGASDALGPALARRDPRGAAAAPSDADGSTGPRRRARRLHGCGARRPRAGRGRRAARRTPHERSRRPSRPARRDHVAPAPAAREKDDRHARDAPLVGARSVPSRRFGARAGRRAGVGHRDGRPRRVGRFRDRGTPGGRQAVRRRGRRGTRRSPG
jgi:hypothetical protein